MNQKRKSEITALEETDRTVYSTFCNAANSLSHFYAQALNQQKLFFQAGERHALEKLNEWIMMRQQEGVRVTGAEISAYLQNELDIGELEVPFSPMPQPQQHPNPNTQISLLAPISQVQPGTFMPATGLLGPLMEFNMDQPNNSVFLNALSTPVMGSLPSEDTSYSEMET